MTQLNSSFLTALQRRYVPTIIGATLLAVFVSIVVSSHGSFTGIGIASVFVLIVALPYVLLYRALIYHSADRVMLNGDALLVRRGRKEAVVPVRNISNIRSITGMSPETVTLDLSTECELGCSISFIPPARLPNGREHPVLAPLRAMMSAH
jgi:hypothetical protein